MSSWYFTKIMDISLISSEIREITEIYQVIMSLCSKYISTLHLNLSYVAVLSLLSCLHKENEPEINE